MLATPRDLLGREVRCCQRPVELRDDTGGPVVVGYAAVFDTPTIVRAPGWQFREVVERGAFSKTLREADVRLLFNHNPDWVLGRTASGTLTLQEDAVGLRVEAVLPDTSYARDLLALIDRADVSQMSFAFEAVRDKWDDDADPPLRRLQEVRLWDVSIVTYPAYPDTTVTILRRYGLDVLPDELLRRIHDGIGMLLAYRGVVPSDVSDRLAPEDTPWEAPTLSDFTDQPWDELSAEEKIRIARHYAWARTMPPETFSDLKLPHHRPSDGAVVWRGVAAAMAALLGARGGVDIPGADRRRVYEHLARHYRQFDREPPEFSGTRSAGIMPPSAAGGRTPARSHLRQRVLGLWRARLRLP